jgi:hypothetical protein
VYDRFTTRLNFYGAYVLNSERQAERSWPQGPSAFKQGPCHHADSGAGACRCTWYEGIEQGGYDCSNCRHRYEEHY